MLEQEFDETVINLLGEIQSAGVPETHLATVKNTVSNLYAGECLALALASCSGRV